jgi:glycine/D-amino acid oxidase-like deaminating enzyme
MSSGPTDPSGRRRAQRSPGSGHRADLVIVGGGFTGLWAAVQAKEDNPSREVVLLERGRFGVAARVETAVSSRPR